MSRLLFCFMLMLGLLACQPTSKPATETETETSEESSIEDGTTCYIFAEGKDSTFLTLTIDGNDVTGYMAWLPWEKDGARGELKGTLDGNKVTADWNYMIEGSEQAEEKVFIIEADAVGEMTGELTEEITEVPGKDPLVKLVLKDPAKAKIGTYLNKSECTDGHMN